MLVSEAKEKVCPFMSQNCICGDCMAWQYTKKFTIKDAKYEYWNIMFKQDLPKDFFENGKISNKYKTDLNENDKEGYCKRLENGRS